MATTRTAAKKTSANITIAKSDLKHKHAEVLLWIAQGKKVEVKLSGVSRWGWLNTNENFSIFQNAEYRLKELEPQNKRYLLKDTLCGDLSLTEKKYRNEEEMRFDFVAPRFKIISVHVQEN